MNYCRLHAGCFYTWKNRSIWLGWGSPEEESSLLWKVELCRIYLELILNRADCAIRCWDLWRRRLFGTVVLLYCFYSCWATANHVHIKKMQQRSVVMFTGWLQIKLTGWKSRDTFRKMTGKSCLLSGSGSCLQWLWVAARGLSLNACVWSSFLGRLRTAVTFWQMEMTVKHDKDDNLMSGAEENET